MSVASFIPVIWAARLLHHLDDMMVARNFYNREYEGEIRDQGDTVRINQIGDISIFDYIRNQDMNPPEETTTAAMDLVIDQAKAFNFQVDDVDAVQVRSPVMDAAMQRAAMGLSSVEDGFLFGLLDAAATGTNRISVTVSTPDEVFATLVQLRTIMMRNNVPYGGRVVAMPPEAIALILKDDRFTATGSDNAEDRLRNGLIGRAVGFDVFEVNNTPDNNIVAGHPIGATFASQIVQTEAFRMERRFADGVKGLSVYGALVTRPYTVAVAEITIA